MDRTQLEDRIRASLQARADDVQPTPALWERVSRQTARRARWQLGLWALAGSAAAVVLVLGAVLALNTGPDGPPVIDEVPDTPQPTPTEPGPSESVAPSPTATATQSAEPTPQEDPAVPAGDAGSVVTTDGSAVYEVDPATGAVRHELDVFAGMAEAGPIGDVAVSPASDGQRLVVATTMAVEASSWEIQVTTFGPDRAVVDNVFFRPIDAEGTPYSPLDPFDEQTRAYPPTVAWSADGTWLAWARGEDDGSVALSALDWEAAQAEPDQVLPETIGTIPASDAPEPYLRVQDWVGDPTAGSQLWLTGPTGGGDVVVDACLPGGPCGDEGPRSLGFEGGTVLDVAHLDGGQLLALVIRSSDTRDAEGATLELLVDPMSDQQRPLPVPDGVFPDGTASPLDGWLVAAGNRVAVGFGDLGGALLEVAGDVVEELEVTGDVALPDGSTTAGIAGPPPPGP